MSNVLSNILVAHNVITRRMYNIVYNTRKNYLKNLQNKLLINVLTEH